MKLRYAIYARVSTARQDKHDLSIPDQLRQGHRHVEEHDGADEVLEFVDRGITGTEDKRPEFLKMIEAATAKPRAFDAIIVHSTSRFYRDPIMSELYQRRLKKNGVRVLSLTQSFSDDPAGDLARQVVALFDQFQSLETAKHVTRCLRANAEAGFWCGAKPPFGYKTYVAEQRGDKAKKKLEINEEEEGMFDLVLKWVLEGDGTSGRLGIKAITTKLNEMGFKTREGKRIYSSFVQKLLSDEAYTGKFVYARNSDNPVVIPIPALMTEDEFRRVRQLLIERRPTVTPPRITTSNVLLSGLAVCASCDGPMMIRVGKNRHGSVYRYYCCAGKILRGSCDGGAPSSIREDELDKVVLAAVADELLTPERTQAIVNAVAERRNQGSGEAATSLNSLRGHASQLKRKIDNLLDAVASGHLPKDLAQEKVESLNSDRVATLGLIESQQAMLDRQMRPISLAEAGVAAERLKVALTQAPNATKKRYLRSVVGEVVVAPRGVTIAGPEGALAEWASGHQSASSMGGVHSSAREWR